jgi:hypothetical protein
VIPQLQCFWDGPPQDDPVPEYDGVLHTPLVANLGIPPSAGTPSRPSVVFVSDDTYREGVERTCVSSGTLRVIDGATCDELASVTGQEDRLIASVTPAIGELDTDGRPEVVAALTEGGVAAYGYNAEAGRMERQWRSRMPDGSPDLHGSDTCLWGGISLYDLTGDGRPEVLFEGVVWSPEGSRIATLPGWDSPRWGDPVTVSDVDMDGTPEAVSGQATWEWDASSTEFVREGYFEGQGTPGFTALADFGDFPEANADEPGRPEVAVVQSGKVTVQTIGGDPVFQMNTSFSGGGPPTVADYDGDGVPEVGAAFGEHYAVFDVADQAQSWAQSSQDLSSKSTGSSVFDFNADGQAEVVYGDECYVRVYDGGSGEVIFSQARYSSTWEENPTVADVDGDSAAEIVMGMSGPCRPEVCPAVDPIFEGLRCEDGRDCPSGQCDEGLCRCEEDSDCGPTYGCTSPMDGTPGSGNVCRAQHRECEAGLRIYRDRRDRWAASRPVWNQHAYHVTNVREDGTVPSTGDMTPHWQDGQPNSFRKNVRPDNVPGPDVTIGELTAVCEGQDTRIEAEVCNRGAALTDRRVQLIFRQQGGQELCRLRTEEPVPPGRCSSVDCVAPVQAEGVFEGVVDPDGIITECVESNNMASGEANCLE